MQGYDDALSKSPGLFEDFSDILGRVASACQIPRSPRDTSSSTFTTRLGETEVPGSAGKIPCNRWDATAGRSAGVGSSIPVCTAVNQTINIDHYNGRHGARDNQRVGDGEQSCKTATPHAQARVRLVQTSMHPITLGTRRIGLFSTKSDKAIGSNCLTALAASNGVVA